MNQAELKSLLKDIRGLRAAVIGDFCLDAYWFLDAAAAEISVETGLETRAISRQRYVLGGAGTVVMNLLALEVRKVHAFGAVGNDLFGREMLRLMQAHKVDGSGVLVQDQNWITHVYAKPYLEEQEQNRIDFGNCNRFNDVIASQLLERIEACLPNVDVVIVNEQVRGGIHSSEIFRSGLKKIIARQPSNLFLLDSRNYADGYSGTIRKMNEREALKLCGIKRKPDEQVPLPKTRQAAAQLYQRWQKPVFITRGTRGCIVQDEKGLYEVPGLHLLGRIDTVGAGDSMLAGISAALGAGYDNLSAVTLGNFMAGVTVQKLFQTGTASPVEILALGSKPDYVYRPELAENQQQAVFSDGSNIELVSEPPPSRRFTHVIFDHDGTISTLRQGWEEIMQPMMVRMILGDKFKTADSALRQKVIQRVNEYIDKTTGIQTISQMQALTRIVAEFNCVPAARIKTASEYKKLYNEELLEQVNRRIAKLKQHQSNAEDFTLKNAAAFVRALHEAGLKLYLASGTDKQDVLNEAAILGYADLFQGRIYGSVGNMTKETKLVIIEQILNDIGAANAARLITFGDGPVEIREAHKRGGYSVGVASNEIQRSGLNHSKRTRLIQAGADLIIPDFSQMDRLLPLLHLT